MGWENILKKPFEMAGWTDEEIKIVKGLGNELGLKVEGPKYRAERTSNVTDDEFEVFAEWIESSKDQNIKLPDRKKTADSKTFLAAA